jgi:hypothetical protein
MRYSVFDSRGVWQASYSHNISTIPLKDIKSWAIQTGRLVGGKVYERIVPKDKKHPPKEHLLYDFTHLPNKLDYRSRRSKKSISNTESKNKVKKNKE